VFCVLGCVEKKKKKKRKKRIGDLEDVCQYKRFGGWLEKKPKRRIIGKGGQKGLVVFLWLLKEGKKTGGGGIQKIKAEISDALNSPRL